MIATELRVGNLVKAKNTNGNPNKWVVIKVKPEHIVTCSDKPDWFKPILLTEEWLVKLGFKLNYTSPRKCYVYKKNNIRIEVYIYKNGRIDLDITKTILNAPRYRHLYSKGLTISNLQNMSFYIINEELKIEL